MKDKTGLFYMRSAILFLTIWVIMLKKNMKRIFSPNMR